MLTETILSPDAGSDSNAARFNFTKNMLVTFSIYNLFKVAVDTKVQGCKSKFDCCDGKVKSKGCRELCKKCDRPWGTLADECYEKDHNIVSFNDKKAIMASLNMLDKPDGKQSKRHKSKKRTKDVNLIEL